MHTSSVFLSLNPGREKTYFRLGVGKRKKYGGRIYSPGYNMNYK